MAQKTDRSLKAESAGKAARTIASLLMASTLLCTVPIQAAHAQGVAMDTSSVRIPQSFRFGTNLKYAQTLSPDVSYLQRFLNASQSTRVAETGAGSNSQLTSYFGLKTKDAVMRFQILHRDEVLAPAGLSAPSGFVGEFTRRKINAMLAASSDAMAAAGAQGGQPIASAAQPLPAYQYPGTTLTTDQQAAFRSLFPEETSVPQWWQQVLADQSGLPQIPDFTPIVASVTSASTSASRKPEVLAISPRIVPSGTQAITITGRNFDPHPTLFGNLGTAGSVSADGQTISFSLKDFDDYERALIYYSSTTQDLFFQVVNEEYASESVGIVTYAFPRYAGPASSTVPVATTTSNTQASQDSALTKGIMAIGAVIGVGLLANALSSAFGSGAASAAASAVDPTTLLFRPFGGRILFLNPCMDSPNVVLYILKAGTVPRPIRLMYVPVVSRLYKNFIMRPGANVLGTYVVGGWCTGGGGIINGTIRSMGTSL